MKKWVKELIKYSIAFVLATGLFFLVVSIRNIFNITDKKQIFRFLSDGFVIPGVVFIGAGALVFVSNFGALNGIAYGLKHAVLMLLPFMKKKHQTYAEFLESRKQTPGYIFIFVVGGLFFTLGILFMILFYTC